MPTIILKKVIRSYVIDETNDILRCDLSKTKFSKSQKKSKKDQLHHLMSLATVSLDPKSLEYDSEATEEDEDYRDPTYLLGLRLKWV